ncbi:MAG: epoxide hydrolase family protein [Pseudohongiellaceae bacterium]
MTNAPAHKPPLIQSKSERTGIEHPSSSKPQLTSRAASTMPEIQPFTIEIPDSSLEDLAHRLALTRLPDQLNAEPWLYGTDLTYLKELLSYWQNQFDWRAQEKKLNSFDQFTTQIDDLKIHFIHQRSKKTDAIPLLLVHGWPGSISEFNRIIGPLTSPEDHGLDSTDSFHVIAPSLPGFGFSEKPSEAGFSPEKIAHLFAELMQTLGYETYAIAGGDWGAVINRHLANTFPERLIGLHSNMILAAPPADPNRRAAVTVLENELREDRKTVMRNEFAYQQIQGTKPQSLGYSLNDSPAGLAAWIVEKFHGWTDLSPSTSRNLTERIAMDDLLTNISIYWHTQTITSSMRIYYENRDTPPMKEMGVITVPTGAAVFPADIYITPKAWAEESYDIKHWTIMPQGGHFAAMEEPELYLRDLQEFFRLFR